MIFATLDEGVEFLFFESEKDFVTYINYLDLDEKTKKENIAHERAHYRAAKRLGYEARYLLKKYPNGSYQSSVAINDNVFRPVRDEHLREILSSPKGLSEQDKRDLERLDIKSFNMRILND